MSQTQAIAGTVETGDKRRILMIAACPFPAPRGTPVRILRMAEELGRRGHDVHVVTYHLGHVLSDVPFKLHRIRNVSTYTKMEPGPSYQKLAIVDPLLATKVMQVAARIKPDIIHAHHYEGLLTALPAKLFRKCPVVFDAHVLLDGELEYYSLGFSARVKRTLGRFLDKHLPRRADFVISISDEIREVLCNRHRFPQNRIHVVPNGVEEPFFRGEHDAFPQDGLKRVIFTGNLAMYQGADLMLEAFAKLIKQRSDVRLLIITDSDVTEFKTQAAALGVLEKIEFKPPRLEDLPNWLASSAVALNPRTVCPGVPQKLLNYMAAGTAIVSFSGSSKYLEHGKTGLVIADGDTDQFAAGMQRLLEDHDLNQRLRRGAQAFAGQNLTWRRNAIGVEYVYDRVLGANRVGRGGSWASQDAIGGAAL